MILFGNMAVIVTFIWDKELRTSINMYILSLSCADVLMSACAAIYARILLFSRDDLLEDPNACKWLQVFFVAGFNFLSGIFTMLAIAADRYRAIVHPSKAKFSKQRTCVTIVIIWLVASLFLMLPYIVNAVNRTPDVQSPYNGTDANDTLSSHGNATKTLYNSPHVFYCSASRQGRTALLYSVVVIAGFYVLPLIVITCLYGRIIYELYSSNSTGAILPEESLLRKRKAIKMMLVIVAMFATAYLPMYVLQTVRSAWLGRSTHAQDLRLGVLLNLSYVLVLCNTWLNVIVYSFYNQTFRTSFRDMLRRFLGCTQKRVRHLSGSSCRTLESQLSKTRASLTLSVNSLQRAFSSVTTLDRSPSQETVSWKISHSQSCNEARDSDRNISSCPSVTVVSNF